MLEFALWENHRVTVVRMSLTAAHEHLQLNEETGALFVCSGEYSPGRSVLFLYVNGTADGTKLGQSKATMYSHDRTC